MALGCGSCWRPTLLHAIILDWSNLVVEGRKAEVKYNSAVNCSFRHLLDVNKAYDARFSEGCFVACCGASHGWVVLVNAFSNLVLHNPFTLASIPLPPITDFACVKAVYDSGGNLEHYVFEGRLIEGADSFGTWFYQKAVLSCSPSKSADCMVMIIHRDNDWLSFVRVGESKWQVASTRLDDRRDRYADCVYHGGRFYTVTYHGIVERWDLDGPNRPTREVIVGTRHLALTLTRHLVSAPWGDLFHVSALFANHQRKYPAKVRFRIRKIDPDGCKEISGKEFVDHAVFLGLNHSACLPTKSFLGLRPRCIYFSAPHMTHTSKYLAIALDGVVSGSTT